jgi:mannan endo-1,4-beta-mannosidase
MQAVGLQYIRGAIAEAAALSKPLVVEEFGFPREAGSFSPKAATTRKDSFYQMVLQQVASSAGVGGALAGANFWCAAAAPAGPLYILQACVSAFICI